MIAGVDEAGRGALAGAVFAAVVILDEKNPIAGLADSKLLRTKVREELALVIRERSIAYAVAQASVEEIDSINILEASLLAMVRAVRVLRVQPTEIVIDGNCVPRQLPHATAIIGGDRLVPSISAASILAKVARDADMKRLDQYYPDYCFATHKGYPTRGHLRSLAAFGVTPIHRKSYAPVRKLLRS